MTTLIAWTAIDQNVATAVYVASDSRLTWGDQGKWDLGRKIFASEKHPEILGYTGDALFCSQVLGQVISFIDTCAPMEMLSTHSEKFLKVRSLLERAFSTYPQTFCLPTFPSSISRASESTGEHARLSGRWNRGGVRRKSIRSL